MEIFSKTKVVWKWSRKYPFKQIPAGDWTRPESEAARTRLHVLNGHCSSCCVLTRFHDGFLIVVRSLEFRFQEKWNQDFLGWICSFLLNGFKSSPEQ